MGYGCCSCVECLLFLSGSPGKSGSSPVDNFPDKKPLVLHRAFFSISKPSDKNELADLCQDEAVHTNWLWHMCDKLQNLKVMLP